MLKSGYKEMSNSPSSSEASGATSIFGPISGTFDTITSIVFTVTVRFQLH